MCEKPGAVGSFFVRETKGKGRQEWESKNPKVSHTSIPESQHSFTSYWIWKITPFETRDVDVTKLITTKVCDEHQHHGALPLRDG